MSDTPVEDVSSVTFHVTSWDETNAFTRVVLVTSKVSESVRAQLLEKFQDFEVRLVDTLGESYLNLVKAEAEIAIRDQARVIRQLQAEVEHWKQRASLAESAPFTLQIPCKL